MISPAIIRAWRGELGVTQAGLAAKLRLPPSGWRTVQRWESGETPIPGPPAVAIALLVAIQRSNRAAVIGTVLAEMLGEE